MDVMRAHWKGRMLGQKKDDDGIYVTMTGAESLLYFSIVAETNSIYRIFIEMRNDGGNGIVHCNIFGNEDLDFPHVTIFCNSTEWNTYCVDVKTGTFSKTVPLLFRMWRRPHGIGIISVRRITIEYLTGSDAKKIDFYDCKSNGDSKSNDIKFEAENKEIFSQTQQQEDVVSEQNGASKILDTGQNENLRELCNNGSSCETNTNEEIRNGQKAKYEQEEFPLVCHQINKTGMEIKQNDIQHMADDSNDVAKMQILHSKYLIGIAEKKRLESVGADKESEKTVTQEKNSIKSNVTKKKKPVEKTSEQKLRLSEAIVAYTTFSEINSGNMKVLFLHNATSEVNQTGIVDALEENGFNVCAFCFGQCYHGAGVGITQDAIVSLATDFQPDWILMQLQFYDRMVSPSTIDRVVKACPNACIVNITVDVRSAAVPYFVEIGKRIYRALIPSVGQLEIYRSAGCKNVDYWRQGYDPKYFYRLCSQDRESLHQKFKHSISFCANRSVDFPGNELREMISVRLNHEYGSDFALYGQGWNHLPLKGSYKRRLPFYMQNSIYNSSKIVISSNNFNDIEKYVSNRQYVSMAAGTVVVSAQVPGMEEFVHGQDLLWFNTIDECVDLCRYCLQNPEEADRIGYAGAQKMKDGYTYYHRIRELAKRLGFNPPSEKLDIKGSGNKNK